MLRYSFAVVNELLRRGFIPMNGSFAAEHGLAIDELIEQGLVETVATFYSLSSAGREKFGVSQ